MLARQLHTLYVYIHAGMGSPCLGCACSEIAILRCGVKGVNEVSIYKGGFNSFLVCVSWVSMRGGGGV